jgi:2'-5' RNA ligase
MASNKSRALRTFFALWPDATVRAILAEHASTAARSAGGRAPRPESLHLTLVFNGATMPDKVEPLAAMMDSIRLPAFMLRFDHAGWFRHTGVAWIGATSPPDELIELQHALARGATRLGFSLDVRPYVPHLTLARNVQRAPPRLVGPAVDWNITAFALVASDLLPEGPRYRILHETTLISADLAAPRVVPHAGAG